MFAAQRIGGTAIRATLRTAPATVRAAVRAPLAIRDGGPDDPAGGA